MEEGLKVAKQHVAEGFQPVMRILNVSKVGATEDVDDDSGLEETEEEVGGHPAAVNAINVQHRDRSDDGRDHGLRQNSRGARVSARLMERVREFRLQSPIT